MISLSKVGSQKFESRWDTNDSFKAALAHPGWSTVATSIAKIVGTIADTTACQQLLVYENLTFLAYSNYLTLPYSAIPILIREAWPSSNTSYSLNTIFGLCLIRKNSRIWGIFLYYNSSRISDVANDDTMYNTLKHPSGALEIFEDWRFLDRKDWFVQRFEPTTFQLNFQNPFHNLTVAFPHCCSPCRGLSSCLSPDGLRAARDSSELNLDLKRVGCHGLHYNPAVTGDTGSDRWHTLVFSSRIAIKFF